MEQYTGRMVTKETKNTAQRGGMGEQRECRRGQISEDVNVCRGKLGTKGTEMGDVVNTGRCSVWISCLFCLWQRKNKIQGS